jgi:hypothetical protein
MEQLLGALAWPVLVVAVTAHFAFLAYLPVGGFLALRWRRSIWLHVPVVVWAIGSVIARYDCPLTDIERWARSRAGLAPLGPAGFIDHYLTGVIYPTGASGAIPVLVFAAVAASWVCYARGVRTSVSGPG